MKAWLVIVGLSLVLAGCTAPAPAPSTPSATSGSPSPSVPTSSPDSTASTTTPSAGTPPAGRSDLILSGTAIGDFPLGATQQSLVERDLVSRLGKPKTGPTKLCQVAGERNRFAVFDHSWGGLTVHYGRRGAATIAVSWEMALDRVPDAVTLVDRLPWRPTFADLADGDGVDISSSAGVRTARLAGRALSYSGPVGASRPDAVNGGPELACR
ncbi:MAG TPA: hypothetical protein VGK53_19850 [Propionicimonas sp.]